MATDLDTPTTRTQSATQVIESGLADLADGLTDGGVRDVRHDDLTALVIAARRAQARLESVVSVAVGEVDARGSHVHEGALTAGAWLRRHTRSTPSEATATVKTARVLRSGLLPETAEAFAEGSISARHAQVIVAGVGDAPAAAVPLIEPTAVDAARRADVRAVSGVMRQFQHALDRERADEAALQRYERRGFSIVPTLDGSMVIRGNADEESGAVIATAVDAASPLVKDDRRTAAQRRLDGLAGICRRFLASPDAPRTARGGHPHVIVTTDEAGMRTPSSTGEHTGYATADERIEPLSAAEPVATAAGDDPVATAAGDASAGHSPGGMLSWVGHITGSTAQRVACDAEVTIARIGPDGEVTDSTTERRYFTMAQCRAMVARDGDRCVWPWCDRPVAWSHGHHLTFWAKGGRTTVANGALPCEGHHVMVHEGKWILSRLPDGRYVVRHPDGRTVGPEPYPPGRHRPAPPQRE